MTLPVPLHQLLAVSALVVTGEKLVASGTLPFEQEEKLRWSIARTRAAFEMQDREPLRLVGGSAHTSADLWSPYAK